MNRELGLPDIRLWRFTEADSQGANDVVAGLRLLSRYVEAFRAAVKLSDTCAEQLRNAFIAKDWENTHTLSAWRFIAARDGAMQIYHFGWTLEELKKTMKRLSPVVFSYIDVDRFRGAHTMLDKLFPHRNVVRNAVGHEAETILHKTEHWTRTNTSYGILASSLNGNTYNTTWKGKVFSYEITEGTTTKLDSVLRHFFSAFDPVVEATHALEGDAKLTLRCKENAK